RAIPDCEQIVRRVDAFRVVWFGIVSGVRLPSAFCRAIEICCISAAPAALDRCPRGFTGHVAHPIRSIHAPEQSRSPALATREELLLRRIDREFHSLVSDASVIEA